MGHWPALRPRRGQGTFCILFSSCVFDGGCWVLGLQSFVLELELIIRSLSAEIFNTDHAWIATYAHVDHPSPGQFTTHSRLISRPDPGLPPPTHTPATQAQMSGEHPNSALILWSFVKGGGRMAGSSILLYFTILYHTILYYSILYYTILYYTILYYTILYYTILYYTILYYTILY